MNDAASDPIAVTDPPMSASDLENLVTTLVALSTDARLHKTTKIVGVYVATANAAGDRLSVEEMSILIDKGDHALPRFRAEMATLIEFGWFTEAPAIAADDGDVMARYTFAERTPPGWVCRSLLDMEEAKKAIMKIAGEA